MRRRALPGWRAVAPTDRARLLRRLATAVEEHGEELAQLETANVGKPIASSRGEVGAVADVLHYYAGAVDKHLGDTIPVAGGVAMTFHEPLGVVGLITPWNFPLLIASWKLGPALACGNTVVLKPSELTPLTALRLAELALEAGLPEGVLEVVVGTGADAGWRLVEHPLRPQDRLHRVDRGGPEDHGRLRGPGEAGDAGAGGQERQHRLRRRRPGRGRGGRALRGVRQLGAGLLRPQPRARRALGLRRLRRAAGRRGGRRHGR